MMLIHDCDVYNSSLYEKSIDNLNNSGLFEFVDKDKDADFRANEEERWVEITIKLKRKGNEASLECFMLFPSMQFPLWFSRLVLAAS